MRLSARRSVASAAVLAAIAAACGDRYIGTFGGSGGVGSASSTAVPPGRNPAPGIACPEKPPAPSRGSSCGNPSIVCEYGSHPDPDCNTIAIACSTGGWEVRRPTACPTACPARFDERRPGTPCSETDVCTYLEATCGCVGAIAPEDVSDGGVDADLDAGADAQPTIGYWQCVRPEEDDCPARRPIAGASCRQEMTCDYGSCLFGRQLQYRCNGTYWTLAFDAGCP